MNCTFDDDDLQANIEIAKDEEAYEWRSILERIIKAEKEVSYSEISCSVPSEEVDEFFAAFDAARKFLNARS